MIDGEDLRDLRLKSLRSAISLVSQNVTLFPGTLKENILYGNPNSTDEEFFKAAEIAEVTDFVETLPNDWNTEIGEGGHRLSGGQRQRVSIARAVLKNAPILVLDEATSSVDNETEAALQRSLEKVRHNRTTLIIAHRLSTVRNADLIAVLSNGIISEIGTHDELIKSGGSYARMWDVQTGMIQTEGLN